MFFQRSVIYGYHIVWIGIYEYMMMLWYEHAFRIIVPFVRATSNKSLDKLLDKSCNWRWYEIMIHVISLFWNLMSEARGKVQTANSP